MPSYSWRAVRRMFLTGMFLFMFAGIVRSQSKWGHHEIRSNRVWSMRLEFATCGLTITRMNIASMDAEGNMTPWSPANPDLTILQWSHTLPIEQSATRETSYGLYDLLTDYAQTRYLVQIIGHGAPGKKFVKFFWVTPVGVSNESIEVPPVRLNSMVTPRTREDDEELVAWINEHEYGHKYLFREFRALLSRTDKKIDITVRIEGSTCRQENKNAKPPKGFPHVSNSVGIASLLCV